MRVAADDWVCTIDDDTHVLTVLRNGRVHSGTRKLAWCDDMWHIRWAAVHVIDIVRNALSSGVAYETPESLGVKLRMLSTASLELSRRMLVSHCNQHGL